MAEIALAIVLVIGAGLLGRSLAAMTAVDMGFDPRQVLVMETAVPVATFKEAPRATAFYRDLLDEVRALPNVESAAGVRSLPTRVMSTGAYGIEGGADFSQQGLVTLPQANFNVVTPDYFRTLRIPVRRGRDFAAQDMAGAPMVAIINESLARQAFPGQDPIGRRIQTGLDTLEFMTIVGIVADIRGDAPTAPPQPETFMPYLQHPGPSMSLTLVARVRLRIRWPSRKRSEGASQE